MAVALHLCSSWQQQEPAAAAPPCKARKVAPVASTALNALSLRCVAEQGWLLQCWQSSHRWLQHKREDCSWPSLTSSRRCKPRTGMSASPCKQRQQHCSASRPPAANLGCFRPLQLVCEHHAQQAEHIRAGGEQHGLGASSVSSRSAATAALHAGWLCLTLVAAGEGCVTLAKQQLHQQQQQ